MSPETVRKVLSSVLGKDENSFGEDDRLVEDLGIDSLFLTVILTEAEDRYGVSIPSAQLEKLKTVGDVYRLVSPTEKEGG